eukprot:TRINITY_DN8378_c1_g1_i1.p1 TRINITY_DN8378_c1_g1~~TRINITY_DN8378_c1_g1_i1.p1  ORF type:complete len:237 (+),score=46.83 TRINITY_DN8378_c1_g1_i1:234-944(+)
MPTYWAANMLTAVGTLLLTTGPNYQLSYVSSITLPKLTKADRLSVHMESSDPPTVTLSLGSQPLTVNSLDINMARSKHLYINGSVNATGPVNLDVLDTKSALSMTLMQAGELSLCDAIHNDLALERLEMVDNLTIGGCDDLTYIASQTFSSLLVVKGSLKIHMTSQSNTFVIPVFPYLRGIVKGICITTARPVGVDLSSLLKVSIQGQCYIDSSIKLLSACPCRTGCQVVEHLSCD